MGIEVTIPNLLSACIAAMEATGSPKPTEIPVSEIPFPELVGILESAPSFVHFTIFSRFIEGISNQSPRPGIDDKRVNQVLRNLNVQPFAHQSGIPSEVDCVATSPWLKAQYSALVAELTSNYAKNTSPDSEDIGIGEMQPIQLVSRTQRGIEIKNPQLLAEAYRLLVDEELFSHLREWHLSWVSLRFPKVSVHLRVLPQIGLIAFIEETSEATATAPQLPQVARMAFFSPDQQNHLSKIIRALHRPYLNQKLSEILRANGLPELSNLIFGSPNTITLLEEAIAREVGLRFTPTSTQTGFWRNAPVGEVNHHHPILQALKLLHQSRRVVIVEGVIDAADRPVPPQIISQAQLRTRLALQGLRITPSGVQQTSVGESGEMLPNVILQLLALVRP